MQPTEFTEKFVGVSAASLLALGFPVALGLWPFTPDLSVDLDAPAPYVLRSRETENTSPWRPGPPELMGRLERAGEPDTTGPGLALRTWQVTYGHRWERQVSVPVLTGPFSPEGSVWPCAVSVRLGAGVFDTTGAGAGLQDMVHQKLSTHFAQTYLGVVHIPALSSTRVTFALRDGAMDVAIAMALEDSSRITTNFVATLDRAADGRLVVSRAGEASTTWEGPSRGAVDQLCQGVSHAAANTAASAAAALPWLGSILGPVAQTLESAVDPLVGELCHNVVGWLFRAVVGPQIDRSLAALSLPESLPLPGGGATLGFRTDAPPRVNPSGVSLRLCPVLRFIGTKTDARIEGPSVLGLAPPELPEDGDRGAVMTAVATPEALQQVLFVLWQSGQGRALGESLREALPRHTRRQLDDLAFRVSSLNPGLPPTVRTAPTPASGWRLTVADVAFGALGERTVMAHGEVTTGITQTPGGLRLDARLADPRVDCVSAHEGGFRVTPCLSDLLPALREQGIPSVSRAVDDATLERWMRFEFEGVAVALSGLRAITQGPGPTLRLRAGVSTRAR